MMISLICTLLSWIRVRQHFEILKRERVNQTPDSTFFSDNTYEVQIDGAKVEGGELESDWDFLPAKKIKDPDAKKPEDW